MLVSNISPAPYCAIVVTAAAPEVPAPLLEQLEAGGRLVLPIATKGAGAGDAGEQTLIRVVKDATGIRREEHGPCRFVPLLGKFGWTA